MATCSNFTQSQTVTLAAGTLSSGFCHESLQLTFNEFVSKTTASIPDMAAFTAGDDTPASGDQDKLWFKQDASDCNAPFGWYFYNGNTAAWEQAPAGELPTTAVTAGAYGSGTEGEEKFTTFTVDANGRLTAAAEVALPQISVAVLTGTISNGSTIPLPSGYTQEQCKWMVGVGTISSTHGDHNGDHNVTFTASASRVVTTSGIGVGSGVANYIIIGVK